MHYKKNALMMYTQRLLKHVYMLISPMYTSGSNYLETKKCLSQQQSRVFSKFLDLFCQDEYQLTNLRASQAVRRKIHL